MARKEKDCPKCGTETAVRGDNDVTGSGKIRECPNPECNWWVKQSGSWSSPNRDKAGWWANL